MVWRPKRTLGVLTGLFILAVLVGMGALLFEGATRQPWGLGLYLTMLAWAPLGGVLYLWGRWYYELLTLRYYLDRNTLIIVCGTHRHIIPLPSIYQAQKGYHLDEVQGLSWPGYIHGQALWAGKPLHVQASEPPQRQILLLTKESAYGISPSDPEGFLRELARYQALGAIRQLAPHTEPAPWLALALWKDRTFWGTALGALIVNAALLGLLALHPEESHPPGSWLSLVRSPFLFPLAGAAVWGVNTLLGGLCYLRDRLAAYLLTGSSLVLEGLLWLATWQALRG